ncbi:EamA family transporter [Paenibacillus caui]|uniref:EamA family transporter n=1 Tax=Paenibacillus caui TaxID=2873927 RepID=UPI001CA7EC95|nr:EamA family transporter [Paenibacillus caui]
MTSKILALIIMMTLLGSIGGVFFKMGATQKKTKYIFGGLLSYGLGSLLNIYLLKKLPYTVVMPANAFTFIWTLFFARWFFKEKVGRYQIIGIVVITTGIYILVN